MFTEIERYVNFIVDNKLSQRQNLFLYLVYVKRYDLMKKYLQAVPVPEGENKFLSKFELEDLIARGFIVRVGEGASVANYELGLGYKKIFIDANVAADELKNVYPAFMKISGANVPLTLMDSYELAALYSQRIGYEVAEHLEVIEDIKYGVEHELIKGKIETFVRSEQWKPIRKLRLNLETITVESNELE